MPKSHLVFTVRSPGLVLVKNNQKPVALLTAVAAHARTNPDHREYLIVPLHGTHEKKFKGVEQRHDSYLSAKQTVINLFDK